MEQVEASSTQILTAITEFQQIFLNKYFLTCVCSWDTFHKLQFFFSYFHQLSCCFTRERAQQASTPTF